MVITAAGVWWLARPAPVETTPVRFGIPPPPQTRLGQFLVLSPDGRHLAFFAQDSGTQRLWVHSFETGESRVLLRAGAVNGSPFWSPDSRFIGFTGEGSLKTIDLEGGLATARTPALQFAGGSWSDTGQIVYAQATAGLVQISATGVEPPTPLTSVDKARGEVSHTGPWFLPGGRTFLYLRSTTDPAGSGIYVGTIDTPPDRQDLTRLVPTRQNAIYAPGRGNDPGRLLFLRDGTLVAQAFDPQTLTLSGEPERVADDIGTGAGGTSSYPFFSVSTTGTLAYRRSQTTVGSAVWVLPTGQETGALTEPLERLHNPRLSPDGRRVALMVNQDLWIYDVGGRPPIKLTSGGSHFSPLWSPDGRTLAIEQNNLVVGIAADGSDAAQRPLSPPQGHFHPHGWSADGTELLLVDMASATGRADIVKVLVRQPDAPSGVVTTSSVEGAAGAALSPDGRWLAYVSDQTGRPEIWVRPYQQSGAAVRISPNGGFEPVWSRDGRALYYREATRIMKAAVRTTGAFNFSPAAPQFESRFVHTGQPPTYDVAADGRFIMIKSADASSAPFNIVLDWVATLRSRAR
jgi:Tol biopolymer transport system component